MSYEEKCIAFLDILGFKEKVKASSNQRKNNGKSNIHQVLSYLNDIDESSNLVKRTYHVEGIIRHISDSIVLVFPQMELEYFFDNIAKFQGYLARDGMFLRGAVTFGEVFSDEKLLYGPGIIEAYELEQKYALYPRVIINEKLNGCIEYREIENDEDIIGVDDDGMKFINWLKNLSLRLENRTNDKTISTIHSEIKKGLEDNFKNPKIHLKYVWLREYFRSVLGYF